MTKASWVVFQYNVHIISTATRFRTGNVFYGNYDVTVNDIWILMIMTLTQYSLQKIVEITMKNVITLVHFMPVK